MCEEWKSVQLGELVERSFSGPSPTCEERNIQSEHEWGVLKTTSVTWSGWNDMAHKVLPEKYWGQGELEVKAGDIIVTKAGPRHRVGVVAYVDKTIPNLIVSGKMIGLRVQCDICLPDVLAGLLSARVPQKHLDHRTTGMAESQVNFANSALLQTLIRMPPKEEQEVISSIGRHLDTQIEKTEALIAKLEKVKEGLLHDLLTRGIDENGQLRPSPEQAPELYKESPLGLIPREWEARPLEDYTSSEITYGIVQAGPHVEGGVPYIRTGDMSGDYLDSSKLLRTSPRIAANYKRSEVNAGDLVVSIRATVGKLLPVPRELSGANLTQGTAKIAPSSKVDSHYLMWAMRSKAVREAIDLEVKGSTFKEITLAALRQVPLAAPSNPSEQAQIGKALQDIGGVLNKEYGVLEKLEVKKSGLMDDLLTGRVRVTQLLDQTQATTPA